MERKKSIFLSINKATRKGILLGVVIYTYNPSTWESEAEGLQV
jgi:hypothetical protein